MNFTLEGGQVLTNTHHWMQCQKHVEGTEPRPCALHNMTDHSMRDFPQSFRADTGLMERICTHGIGHPDPDSLPFFTERGIEGMGVHGCDGCCLPPLREQLESIVFDARYNTGRYGRKNYPENSVSNETIVQDIMNAIKFSRED